MNKEQVSIALSVIGGCVGYTCAWVKWIGKSLLIVITAEMLLTGAVLGKESSTSPLEPPDTSSPRATMQSFVQNMEQAHQAYLEWKRAYYQEPGWYPSPETEKNMIRVIQLVQKAKSCFDLSQLPPAYADQTAFQATLLLKTILDRIGVPPLQSVPDDNDMDREELSRWRIPQTQFTISRIKEGSRVGEYLFSADTVNRLDDDYERVKALPYKPGAWEGVYKLYTEVSGAMIPDKLTDKIPDWGRIRVLNHPLWKWILLCLVLAIGVLLLVLIDRITGFSVHDSQRTFRRMLLALSILTVLFLVDFVQAEIAFRGDANEAISSVLKTLFFLTTAWTILLLGNVIAENLIGSPRVQERSLDAAIVRVTSKLISVLMAIGMVLFGAHYIGIPVLPLLAGLGVGGLALALAAQPTVENFIGGLNLFADRPVRLGEMCKFGDRVGTIEEIGIRSTRVRTMNRTLVTVPNADFSKMHLENYSRRDMMWYHPRLRLRYETTPDQIRYILVEVRKLLYAHPKVFSDNARVRFIEFGTYSLDLDVSAYVTVVDYPEFLEIAEDLHLRIMGVATKAGTTLAIPAWQSHVEEGRKINEQETQQAEDQVKEWREKRELYLPKFPQEKIAELEGSLDYPPEGTPGWTPKRKIDSGPTT